MSTPSSSELVSARNSASSHIREGPHSSPRWTAHSPVDSASSNQTTHLESALTSSPNSRTTRLPSKVSATSNSYSSTSKVAISSQISSDIYSTTRQDVRPIVNTSSSSSSSVPRFNAQPSLETSVSNYLSSNNVLNSQSTRPRTSNQVFVSPSDLAAHYGIPLSLPPLPSVQSHRSDTVTQPQSHSTAIPDFSALKDSYLSMLSQKSAEPIPSVDMSSATVSPADLQRPVAADFGMDLEGILKSLAEPSNGQASDPFASPFEPNDFLTSPWTPSLDNVGESPDDTPYTEFLSTPLIPDNNMFSGPLDGSLFSDPLYPDFLDSEKAPESSTKAPSLDTSGLLIMSPSSPALDALVLNPSSLVSPSQCQDVPQEGATGSGDVPSRRRSGATGTRKNVTPDSLVPLEAPTQPRKYLTPSATSRKELPAVFARKRARQQMLDGEEDELAEEPLKPNATELEQIEWKRRQNTLAARKSRKRKLLHQQDLETKVATLAQEKEVWRQRALMLQHLLQSHGVPFNEFQD